MNNVTKKLVQAYYEKNGSFDRIQNSIVGAEITGNDSLDQLYGILGYDGGDTGKTPKQIHDLRQAYIRCNLNLAKVIDPSLDSMEKLKDFLAQTNNVPVTFETADVKPPKRIEKYVNVLAEFYRNSDMLVKTDAGLAVLSVHLASVKYAKIKLKSEMQKLLNNNPSMRVSIKQGDTVCVFGKKMIVDTDLSLKQIDNLHLFALCKAAMGSVVIPFEVITRPNVYFTAGILDTTTYLHLLDNAEALDKTYNEMLLEYNIFMPDFEQLYKATGSVFVTIGDNVTAILSKDEDKVIQMNVNDFNMFLAEGL